MAKVTSEEKSFVGMALGVFVEFIIYLYSLKNTVFKLLPSARSFCLFTTLISWPPQLTEKILNETYTTN
jgi:hypothetical protein